MRILHASAIVLGASISSAVLGCFASQPAVSQTTPAQSQLVDAAGTMRIPPNYRTEYEFLGTWSVAGEKGAKEMHIVYASPGTAKSYRDTGKFPDGSVLVKEVFATATTGMTTGLVSHADQLKGWFMMVKDSKNSYPSNKLWGNGWGWSWFDAGDSVKTTSTDFRADCLGCHIPARGTDWIYVPGYPSLKK